MCFPVNFVKFLRTPLFTEHLWRLVSIFKMRFGDEVKAPNHVQGFSSSERFKLAGKCTPVKVKLRQM